MKQHTNGTNRIVRQIKMLRMIRYLSLEKIYQYYRITEESMQNFAISKDKQCKGLHIKQNKVFFPIVSKLLKPPVRIFTAWYQQASIFVIQNKHQLLPQKVCL